MQNLVIIFIVILISVGCSGKRDNEKSHDSFYYEIKYISYDCETLDNKIDPSPCLKIIIDNNKPVITGYGSLIYIKFNDGTELYVKSENYTISRKISLN